MIRVAEGDVLAITRRGRRVVARTQGQGPGQVPQEALAQLERQGVLFAGRVEGQVAERRSARQRRRDRRGLTTRRRG